ncbi:MAG: hypothetical protein AUG51_19345 [Acidobacteria bacterium 13_1_20CM_3_53_8]|nr:MAG: hypothetical protein AUG51_19345 [Acidobacteria bacterium 13_1_20CM_3_53_8]
MPLPPRTEPWKPLYAEATLIGPLVENAIAVVKRDQVAALAWAAQRMATALGLASPRALPDFKSVENSDTFQTKFPWAIIEPGRSSIEEQANGECLKEEHTIEIEFAITGRSWAQLTTDLETYALAMQMMLVSARPEDLLAGYGPCIEIAWEVSDHEYSRSGKDDSGFFRAAKMTMKMRFEEVMSNG